MLKCTKCIYKQNVPGNTHIACTRGSARAFNVNEHGVEKGWFLFPYLFDPIWAEGCYGFVSKDEKSLESMTTEELGEVLKTELIAVNIVLRNENEPLRVREAILKKYAKAVEAIPAGKNNASTIVLINELRKI